MPTLPLENYFAAAYFMTAVFLAVKYKFIVMSVRDYGRKSRYFPDTIASIYAARKPVAAMSLLLVSAIPCLLILRILHNIGADINGATHAFTFVFISSSAIASLQGSIAIWWTASLSRWQALISQSVLGIVHFFLVLVYGSALQFWSTADPRAFNFDSWLNLGIWVFLAGMVVALLLATSKLKGLPKESEPDLQEIYAWVGRQHQDLAYPQADSESLSVSEHVSDQSVPSTSVEPGQAENRGDSNPYIFLRASVGCALLVLGSKLFGFLFEPLPKVPAQSPDELSLTIQIVGAVLILATSFIVGFWREWRTSNNWREPVSEMQKMPSVESHRLDDKVSTAVQLSNERISRSEAGVSKGLELVFLFGGMATYLISIIWVQFHASSGWLPCIPDAIAFILVALYFQAVQQGFGTYVSNRFRAGLSFGNLLNGLEAGIIFLRIGLTGGSLGLKSDSIANLAPLDYAAIAFLLLLTGSVIYLVHLQISKPRLPSQRLR